MNLKKLWKQFLPLSLSDIVMALGDPLHHAALAQLDRPREHLAAYGVAKSLAIFFESPIIMLLHAANALAGNPVSRLALKKFTSRFCLFLSVIFSLLLAPFIYPWFSKNILGLGDDISALALSILFFLIPWPLVIGWRRFYQGQLIRYGFGNVIGKASIIRVFYVAGVLYFGVKFLFPATAVAGLALMGGIVVESAIVISNYYFRRDSFDKVLDSEEKQKILPQDTWQAWNFFWPLSLSMMIVWGGRVLLTALVARAGDAQLALAVWPVSWGIVLLLSNSTRMIQQITISNKNQMNGMLLAKFTLSVGAVFTLPLVLLSIWGKSFLLFYLGNDLELVTAVLPILRWCMLFPMLIALQNALQGYLIGDGKTKLVNIATVISVFCLAIITWLLIIYGMKGAQAAALGVIISMLIEISILKYSLGNKT
ncbi:MAG: hypothetical protein JNM93_11710 [Bacteriovoracaceae bacterium]|nr:hypothetical protein [Bacteriovoracaceae bacterium]